MIRSLSSVHIACCRLEPCVSRPPFLSRILGSTRNYAKRAISRTNELKPVTFEIPSYTSVSDLSNMTSIKIEKLIRDLTKMGFTNVTHNYILSREYVELVLSSYNYKVEDQTSSLTPETVYEELRSSVNPKNLKKRPPIVTIMGHVDHGKTTILDYLRNSTIVSNEHGGITQHIGAFQVKTPISKRTITFLDTPGHAAFLKMRERGATITDIVILVISAEDSLMPQTLEALKHARNSGNQMVVAITKIDRFSNPKQREAAIEKVNLDMMNHEIPIERIGGDVQVVPISARTGENMELLEESIVLLSDVMDLKAESGPQTTLEGYILESEMKKTTGNVSTILVTKGELRKGKVLICGNTYCKVRSIKNENGQDVSKATPAQAVEITGWKDLPGAGDEVIEAKNEATAKKYVAKRLAVIQTARESENVDRLNEQRATKALSKLKKVSESGEGLQNSENDPGVEENGPKKVNFIVKGDVSGSVEAIVESIASLGNEEVKCNIVTASVGVPNENDMKMARITGSKLLCFNLGPLPHEIVNNKDEIEVAQFNVIYKLIEDVTETLTDNLKPIYETKQVASAEIRDIFNFSVRKKTIKIAGCKVLSGQVSRNATVKIIRGADEKVVYDGTILSLKQGKEDASLVKKNNECGITFGDDFESYEPGDKIVVYEKVKVPRYL
ncbi:LAQU0S02e02916g1_1 [Lachancea quebecensis]|uniref:Translation initiation factor IF-2, mitochondrial n=1 Tax=Lachancea quebecensis TaxID=1654605 RepID=A0A0P1KLY8_9SACH|nr:LAQU0S02e02916g1_1 [Lachancea quebecensis]